CLIGPQLPDLSAQPEPAPAQGSPPPPPTPSPRWTCGGDRHAGSLAPRRQRRLTDTELGSNLCDRRALGVPVERDGVTLELLGIIFPCHRVGSSRFPQDHP